ncbi:hypothetical protein F4824DRAFT_506033 [Ustulina deusta]|nr:hypothetical protein F4824DRAFT_506033 [Ustulina deusta]
MLGSASPPGILELGLAGPLDVTQIIHIDSREGSSTIGNTTGGLRILFRSPQSLLRLGSDFGTLVVNFSIRQTLPGLFLLRAHVPPFTPFGFELSMLPNILSLQVLSRAQGLTLELAFPSTVSVSVCRASLYAVPVGFNGLILTLDA